MGILADGGGLIDAYQGILYTMYNKGERESQRAENICFSFSCLVIKYDFYFTVHKKF